ncbi:toll/interleukin-1 receptor domain-containing protein [Hwangdonia lutea]|uniref:Toll/interleukin-1 receptor domain-containing protein n=1 Tax=Hwangdonia lutea TaxID=3075823 RepID=A0AA97ENC1_9FLAO|nr:toll/interleukin-1 receptor domain-containing protein [Hwangdonia sp. SCSIO 19198]WOD43148.1 toll/interleukin-1 receptor domain-containing protein [Hwangdonia sp. SCSIO 19198]
MDNKNIIKSKVFLSHAHEDSKLADSLKKLLEDICDMANLPKIDIFFSSNLKPGGGMELGEWRTRLEKEIEDAILTIAIVTPDSNDKPWLAYESGMSIGRAKKVTPILYFMGQERLHSVYRNQQAYIGEDLDSMRKCCYDIITAGTKSKISAGNIKFWDDFIQKYIDTVKTQKNDLYFRSLFRDQFHNSENASKFEGNWFAKWTQINEDGSEEVFEKDELYAWTTANRIRFVGYSQKHGTEGMKYPMEGIVSPDRKIALSYWSEGEISICGTCLMKTQGAGVDTLIGNWQGYTAKSIDDDPTYFSGRVIMSKTESKVDAFAQQN